MSGLIEFFVNHIKEGIDFVYSLCSFLGNCITKLTTVFGLYLPTINANGEMYNQLFYCCGVAMAIIGVKFLLNRGAK